MANLFAPLSQKIEFSSPADKVDLVDSKEPSGNVMYQSEMTSCVEYELPHLFVPSPVAWHSKLVKELDPLESCGGRNREGGKVTFILDARGALLKKFILTAILPPITVKPEHTGHVALQWRHNLAHNLMKEGKLACGDIVLDELDSSKLDHTAFMTKKNTLCHWYRPYEACKQYQDTTQVSHVNRCDEAWTVSCEHPWYYSLCENQGFPLFVLKSDRSLTHEYICRDPLELVHMQILNLDVDVDIDSMWTNVDPMEHADMLQVGEIKYSATAHCTYLTEMEQLGLVTPA